MNIENKYLSDAELDLLILEVEENELITAPPEFAVDVMTKIIVLEEKKKNIEFQRYCIRVLSSVAAAIALVFFMPNIEPEGGAELPTRQELIGETISREEALDDRKFLTKLMSSLNREIGGILDETEKEK